MEESAKALKKQFDSVFGKIRHPFVYSFMSSWAICNWIIIYLLVCGIKNPDVTIAEIYSLYPLNSLWTWVHLVLFPAMGMLAYIFLGPFFLNWYLLYVHKGEVKRRFDEAVQSGFEPIPKKRFEQIMSAGIKAGAEIKELKEVLAKVTDLMATPPGQQEKKLQEVGYRIVSLEMINKELERKVNELKAENVLLKRTNLEDKSSAK